MQNDEEMYNDLSSFTSNCSSSSSVEVVDDIKHEVVESNPLASIPPQPSSLPCVNPVSPVAMDSTEDSLNRNYYQQPTKRQKVANGTAGSTSKKRGRQK